MTEKIDLADVVKELCDTHQHREPYTHEQKGTTWQTHHVSEVPSLISQLDNHEPSNTGDSQGSGGFKSQPAAHLESLDILITIDLEAARWIRDLGEDDPAGEIDDINLGTYKASSGTIACVRKLYALRASATEPAKREIERDIRRWRSLARIVTGYDTAAWRPHNTCPICSARGGLRVRVLEKIATCIECKNHWDETNIGLLAEHIRAENLEDEPEEPETKDGRITA